MNYFTQPPQPAVNKKIDVPAFVKKWYQPNQPKIDARYILKLVAWAELEFQDTVSYYQAQGAQKQLEFLNSIDCAYILCYSKEFKVVISAMTQETWDKLPKVIRRFLSKTVELCNKSKKVQ